MGQRLQFVLDLLLTVSVVTAADVYFSVVEESTPGLLVGSIPDSIALVNQVSGASLPYMRYSLLRIDPTLRKYFSLDDKSGELRLSPSHVLDREVVCQFNITCNLDLQIAIQSTHTQFFRKVLVSIEVIDINDHAPYFKENSTVLTISESVQVPTSFPLPSASDKDTSISYSLQTYEIFPKDGPFELLYSDLNPNLMLRVVRELDHEMTQSYSLRIIARDGGNPQREGVLNVQVVVEDVNDNSPKFTQENYAKIVDETVNQGSLLLTLTATDADSGKNGQIFYRLSPDQPASVLSMFAVDAQQGDFRLIGDFQNADTELYRVEVEAQDMADQPFTIRTTVTIQVEDTVNSKPKLLISYLSQNNYSSISEHANIGVAVAHIIVRDTDRGLNGVVKCDITANGFFELRKFDENEYNVIVAKPLDREHIQTHNVTVLCSDSGASPLSVWEFLQVLVTDENDNTPAFLDALYNITIRENNEIDKEILRVTAMDDDDHASGNGRLTYSLQDVMDGQFLINPDTGAIKVMTSFDYEVKRKLNFTVTAEDNGKPRRSATVGVIVNILDENDQVPSFTQSRFTLAVSEYTQPGDLVAEMKAYDSESGKNGEFEISLIPGSATGRRKHIHMARKDNFLTDYNRIDDKNLPFDIHPNGSLTLKSEIDHEVIVSYEFEIRVTDKGDPPLSDTATVVIGVKDENDNSPEIVYPNVSQASFTALTGPDAPWTLFAFEVVDKDSGINNFLMYAMTARNDSGRFVVESDGQVKRSRDFSRHDIGTYKLSVVVKDNGTPPLSDIRTFLVHIRGGNDTAGSPSAWRDQYLIITVTLVCATILLSVTIVLIMVIMRRLDNRRKIRGGASRSRDHVHVRSSPITSAFVDPAKVDKPRKEVDEKDDRDDETGSVDEKKLKEPHFGISSSSANINMSSMEVNGYKIPAMFPEDAVSDSSGETIASDSGRGGSDEDISITNMAAGDFNEHSPGQHPGHNTFRGITFNPDPNLKSSVKQTIRSNQRKHVTFKDMRRFLNGGEGHPTSANSVSQRTKIRPVDNQHVTFLDNSLHFQPQKSDGTSDASTLEKHRTVTSVSHKRSGRSYNSDSLGDTPYFQYDLQEIPPASFKYDSMQIPTDNSNYRPKEIPAADSNYSPKRIPVADSKYSPNRIPAADSKYSPQRIPTNDSKYNSQRTARTVNYQHEAAEISGELPLLVGLCPSVQRVSSPVSANRARPNDFPSG